MLSGRHLFASSSLLTRRPNEIEARSCKFNLRGRPTRVGGADGFGDADTSERKKNGNPIKEQIYWTELELSETEQRARANEPARSKTQEQKKETKAKRGKLVDYIFFQLRA